MPCQISVPDEKYIGPWTHVLCLKKTPRYSRSEKKTWGSMKKVLLGCEISGTLMIHCKQNQEIYA